MKCQGGQKEQTEIVPPGAQDPAKKENLKKKKKKNLNEECLKCIAKCISI